MKPQFCSHCGTRLNEDARFCHICGRAVCSPAIPAQPPEAPVQPISPPIPQPAPAPQSAPAPQPTPKPKCVWSRPADRPRTAGAAILCVLIFLCACLSIGLANLNNLTSESLLEQTVENLVMDLDLTTLPARDVIPSAEPGQCMACYIAREIEKNYTVPISVGEEDVQEFLEDSNILPFLAEKLSEYTDDIRNDRRGTGITQRELKELLWDNSRYIEKLTGMPLTQKDVDNVLAKADTDGLMRALQAKTLKKDSPVAYAAARVALSDATAVILAVLMLAMAVLVARSYKWNIFQACGSVGKALAISGGISLGLTFVALLLSLIWNSIISYALRVVFTGGLWAGSVTFILGVVLVVVNKLSKRFMKTR
ncbi:MAG: zinc ribbon domain-containing protein [Clostridia bacterium]|nr:zinc ribbon domain-containing protein [Clostridia bacterium]